MIKLSNYLNKLDLKELIEVLEKDDDIENVLIILQMLEINDLAALERIKMQLQEEVNEEDELLENEQEKEKKKKEMEAQQQKAKNKHSKTKEAIDSILEQPANFWKDNNISSFANSLLGTIIVPNTKESRSSKASNILFGIAKAKEEKFAKETANNRKSLLEELKRIRKEKERVRGITV
jgi:hypothetical protein